VSSSSRRHTRRRLREKRRMEEVKEGVRGVGRGAVWSALLLLLLASVAGIAAMVIAGMPLYAVLFLPSAVLSGLALKKWEGD
jgi:hypothetical protein